MSGPYSRKRLLGFYLMDLPRDPRGVPAGPNYGPYLKARTMRARKNLRPGHPGVWSGRRHQLAGLGEYEVFTALEGNPAIVDIREQYPLASERVLMEALEGKRAAKNAVPTIDFVITLAPLERFGPLRYHGLSFKPENIREMPGEVRRRQREQLLMAEFGWPWSYIDPVSETQHFNNQKLAGWTVRRCLDEAWGAAQELAALFYRTTSTKTLRGQLEMFARRLRIPPEEQWFVFAAAYYFGFLRIDHRHPLKEDGPLVLAARRNDG